MRIRIDVNLPDVPGAAIAYIVSVSDDRGELHVLTGVSPREDIRLAARMLAAVLAGLGERRAIRQSVTRVPVQAVPIIIGNRVLAVDYVGRGSKVYHTMMVPEAAQTWTT